MFLAGAFAGERAVAQSPSKVEPAVFIAPLGPVGPAAAATPQPATIEQVGCKDCDGGLFPAQISAAKPGLFGYGRHHAGCAGGDCNLGCTDAGCGEGNCVAGRVPCETCEGTGPFSRLLCQVHKALVCPDPCYEPKWTLPPNSAFFVNGARPVTMTRFRWDAGRRLTTPDRSEYFWAKTGGKGPANPETRVDYDELHMYLETGSDRFSFFVNTPYRSLDSDKNGGSGGFSDLTLGTKTLVLDTELLQLSFQLSTFVPVGVPRRGTGVGHVSMEPALISAVKLFPETYMQNEVAYWIPIAATSGASGGVFRQAHSLNHTLMRFTPDMLLVGTFELQGWSFTAGTFTDPITGQVRSGNGTNYLTLGPGLRFGISDKLDFGIGMQFAVTKDHFAEQLYRSEIRWRF